jgi:hypothetical protein
MDASNANLVFFDVQEDQRAGSIQCFAQAGIACCRSAGNHDADRSRSTANRRADCCDTTRAETANGRGRTVAAANAADPAHRGL